jgi:hypothetical protein
MNINELEILKAISKLKNGSAPGADNITSELLKKYKQILCHPLKHIYNLCLNSNCIPNAFKTSIVTPIHKKGSYTSLKNYRPISIISNIAKVFEKIIKNRLVEFLEKNNLLFENQFGFRPGKGTDQAIAKTTNIIYDALEKEKKCASIYLDLAKAFDTINHGILLNKMKNIGITGPALELFKSYLSDRKQLVKINKTHSDEMKIIYLYLYYIYIYILYYIVGYHKERPFHLYYSIYN